MRNIYVEHASRNTGTAKTGPFGSYEAAEKFVLALASNDNFMGAEFVHADDDTTATLDLTKEEAAELAATLTSTRHLFFKVIASRGGNFVLGKVSR